MVFLIYNSLKFYTDRLARFNDPANEDFTGKEIFLTEVGSGMSGFLRPLICYTTDTINVKWIFPNGTQVRLVTSDNTPSAARNSDMYSWNGSRHGVSLHRASDFYLTGEYCCKRNGTTQRLCLNISKHCTIFSIARYNYIHNYMYEAVPIC